MTQKHTPAPWRIQGEDEIADGVPVIEIVRDVEIGKDFESVCYVQGQFLDSDVECEGDIVITERVKANAKLIAAAPELLEALKALSDLVTKTDFAFSSQNIQAQLAIAKAEGK